MQVTFVYVILGLVIVLTVPQFVLGNWYTVTGESPHVEIGRCALTRR